MSDAQGLHETQEVSVQKEKPASRNPIARSFGAGINRPQVIADKKRKDRLAHRRNIMREIEFDG